MCLKYMINTQTLRIGYLVIANDTRGETSLTNVIAVSPRVENVTKTNLRSRVWND